MKQHAAFLAIVACFTFTAAQTAASPAAPASVGTKESSETASQAKLFKPGTAPESASSTPTRGHTFVVNDEKGLLLKCIAPQLDTDPDTDIFNSCTLAPGRTLDDVMHTFIRTIHYVQNEQLKERAEWYKEREEEPAQKPAQK